MEELSANKFFRYKYLIVCILSPLSAGGGGLSLLPNFLKGGELDRISVFKGGLLSIFSGGCRFYKKSMLKSEMFNDKKSS